MPHKPTNPTTASSATSHRKPVPFTLAQIEAIAATHPTPFHIYDEAAIREGARALSAAFGWVPGGFVNYFAVKALPNPHILRILREEGMGADCSSLVELILAERAGITGENIRPLSKPLAKA